MKVYKVGGCVRDHLLGLEPKDIDFVVVGATSDQMLSEGYTQVGASFPVFLKNGCEYALARTERKTGVGYSGFAVDINNVTLEDDLLRRDLTINSMAMDDDGLIIDPYGGVNDLSKRILRHTSEAFAEDPIRVLRVARFAARYGNFKIHETTLELMTKVAPELVHVPGERIWAELEKGLSEQAPSLMFHALKACGANQYIDQGPRPIFNWSAPFDLLDQKSSIGVRMLLASSTMTVPSTSFDRIRMPSALSKLHAEWTNLGKSMVEVFTEGNHSLMVNMWKRLRRSGSDIALAHAIKHADYNIVNDWTELVNILKQVDLVDCASECAKSHMSPSQYVDYKLTAALKENWKPFKLTA